MSIRAEEAAAEAQRFSLRTSLFGSGAAPVRAPAVLTSTAVAAPAPAPMPPPMPQHTLPGPLKLSFNSLTRSQATENANHEQNLQRQAATMQAIAKIAEAQKRRNATCMPVVALTQEPSRTLSSGFIAGGNARVDPTAEVLRLTATIDTLNSKISAQADRLQRTEASLVKSNRAMTSERATANARLLRLQTENNEMKARETTIKEVALSQARLEVQKSSASFSNSVKRVKDYESNIGELQSNLDSMKLERASAMETVEKLRLKLEETTQKLSADAIAAANDKERVAKIERAYQVDKEEITSQLAAATERCSALALDLQGAHAKHDEVGAQLATAANERDDAMNRLGEAQKVAAEAAERARKTDATAEELLSLLRADNDALRVRLEAAEASLQSQCAEPTKTVVEAVVETAADTEAVIEAAIDTETVLAEMADLTTEEEAVIEEMAEGAVSEAVVTKDTVAAAEMMIEAAEAVAGMAADVVETAVGASIEVETQELLATLREENTRLRGHVEVLEQRVLKHAQQPTYSSSCGDHGSEHFRRWLQEADAPHRSAAPTMEAGDVATVSSTSVMLPSVRFHKPPVPLRTQVTDSSTLRHPIARSLSAAPRRGVPVALLPGMARHRLSERVCQSEAGTELSTDASVPKSVAALVAAVSKDMIAAALYQRRVFSQNAGFTDEEIEDDIARLLR